jgi:hypothetical protein
VADSSVTKIVFVDDFLGTGRQFGEFFDKWDFSDISNDVQLFYAPLMAHKAGIDYVSGKLPSIQIVTAETLYSRHGFFSNESWGVLGHGTVTCNDATDWYEKFVDKNKIKPKNINIYGVGELALTVGFSHGTPNNSLPILWYSGNGWCPLLER